MKKIIFTVFATALATAPALAQDTSDAAAAGGQPGTSTTEQTDKPAAGPADEAAATTADSTADKPAAPVGAEAEDSSEGETADKPAEDNPQKLG